MDLFFNNLLNQLFCFVFFLLLVPGLLFIPLYSWKVLILLLFFDQIFAIGFSEDQPLLIVNPVQISDKVILNQIGLAILEINFGRGVITSFLFLFLLFGRPSSLCFCFVSHFFQFFAFFGNLLFFLSPDRLYLLPFDFILFLI